MPEEINHDVAEEVRFPCALTLRSPLTFLDGR
jgi:hypothetical protein